MLRPGQGGWTRKYTVWPGLEADYTQIATSRWQRQDFIRSPHHPRDLGRNRKIFSDFAAEGERTPELLREGRELNPVSKWQK